MAVTLIYFDFYCEGSVKDPFACLPEYSECCDVMKYGNTMSDLIYLSLSAFRNRAESFARGR